jgi:hypothetical protein
MSNGNRQITLRLPAPHPGQQKVLNEARRFSILACGRRFGKTVLGMDRVIKPALQGFKTAWFAPNYRLLAEVWRNLLETLRPVLVAKNETEKRIELMGGGSIDCWSLDSPDAGRGRAYKCIVVDEAAIVPDLETAWQQSLRAVLTDDRGEAWFLSTPKGIAGGSAGYFYQMFVRGQDPEQPDWASWQIPTSCNPFIDPAEIASARLDLSEIAFAQEYEARFVSWEGAVFRNILRAVWEPPEELKRFQAPSIFAEWVPTFAIGVDWGRSNDYTVFTVGCTAPDLQPPQQININTDETPVMPCGIVEVERFRGVPYALQRARLHALYERYGRPVVLAESNAMGQPVIEQLASDGMNVRGFTTQNNSKMRLIDDLALVFERDGIKIPNDPALIGELQSFESQKLPSGLVRYSAPAGGNDDTVISLGLCYRALKYYAGAFSMDPRSIEAQKQFALRILTGGGGRFWL